MLSVIYAVTNMPFILNVVMLNAIMLTVIMLNVVTLNVVMLNVTMLNIVLLNGVMLNVIMLNVVAPINPAKVYYGLSPENLLVIWSLELCLNALCIIFKLIY